MAVTIEMQNTGDSRARREILAGVEHVLSDLAGEWRVSMVGSRANDDWERKGEGPHGFERSYALVGEAAEHQPEAIRNVLIKLLPASARRSTILVHVAFQPKETSQDLAASGLRDGGISDEEDSEFKSSSQRPGFASVESD
jgi:hypothetical protein